MTYKETLKLIKKAAQNTPYQDIINGAALNQSLQAAPRQGTGGGGGLMGLMGSLALGFVPMLFSGLGGGAKSKTTPKEAPGQPVPSGSAATQYFAQPIKAPRGMTPQQRQAWFERQKEKVKQAGEPVKSPVDQAKEFYGQVKDWYRKKFVPRQISAPSETTT